MRRSLVLVAMSLGIVLAPVMTWWLIGDMSESIEDPDYMIRPVALTGTQELVLGAAATAGLLIAVAVVAVGLRQRQGS